MSEEQNDEIGEVLNESQIAFLIPECCREGWESCPHVPKREKPSRGNIAL